MKTCPKVYPKSLQKPEKSRQLGLVSLFYVDCFFGFQRVLKKNVSSHFHKIPILAVIQCHSTKSKFSCPIYEREKKGEECKFLRLHILLATGHKRKKFFNAMLRLGEKLNFGFVYPTRQGLVYCTRPLWPPLRAHLHMAKNLSTKSRRNVNEVSAKDFSSPAKFFFT